MYNLSVLHCFSIFWISTFAFVVIAFKLRFSYYNPSAFTISTLHSLIAVLSVIQFPFKFSLCSLDNHPIFSISPHTSSSVKLSLHRLNSVNIFYFYIEANSSFIPFISILLYSISMFFRFTSPSITLHSISHPFWSYCPTNFIMWSLGITFVYVCTSYGSYYIAYLGRLIIVWISSVFCI